MTSKPCTEGKEYPKLTGSGGMTSLCAVERISNFGSHRIYAKDLVGGSSRRRLGDQENRLLDYLSAPK